MNRLRQDTECRWLMVTWMQIADGISWSQVNLAEADRVGNEHIRLFWKWNVSSRVRPSLESIQSQSRGQLRVPVKRES